MSNLGITTLAVFLLTFGVIDVARMRQPNTKIAEPPRKYTHTDVDGRQIDVRVSKVGGLVVSTNFPPQIAREGSVH